MHKISLFLWALVTALLTLCLVEGFVWAMGPNANAVPMVGSASAEGSHVFAFRNLAKVKVVWASATTARYLMIFDSTSLPANGATTSCSSEPNTSGCLAWCGYMPNSTTAPNEQWFDWGFWPLKLQYGTVAAVSTGANCGTLTVDGSNDFLYAQGN